MSKFTLICEDEELFNVVGGYKTTKEFSAHSLDEVLQQVEFFLRGSGFYFNGKLDILEDECLACDDVPNNEDIYIDLSGCSTEDFNFAYDDDLIVLDEADWPFDENSILNTDPVPEPEPTKKTKKKK